MEPFRNGTAVRLGLIRLKNSAVQTDGSPFSRTFMVCGKPTDLVFLNQD
jgi:hypothetical protein